MPLHDADTSALAKLVIGEPESPALRRWLTAARPTLVTSDLTRTELMRAVRRVAPERLPASRAVLDAVTVVTLSTADFEQAGRLEPPALRSLDAVHLAAALALGDDLAAVVTYDDRMAESAARAGLNVEAPGA